MSCQNIHAGPVAAGYKVDTYIHTYTIHMNGCVHILRQQTHTQTQLSSEPQASDRVSGRRHEVVAMGTSRKAEFITDITRSPNENQASNDQ